MKAFLTLLPIASLALAAELPPCAGGALKCCAGVTPYSVLPNDILAEYGVDSADEGNICGNGEYFVEKVGIYVLETLTKRDSSRHPRG